MCAPPKSQKKKNFITLLLYLELNLDRTGFPRPTFRPGKHRKIPLGIFLLTTKKKGYFSVLGFTSVFFRKKKKKFG